MPVKHTHRRGEEGTVAILVAFLSVGLIGLAAMVVDLGNAFVQRREIHAQADFAALAGGARLPGSKVGSSLAVIDAANYLSKNNRWVQTGNPNNAVLPSELVDGNDKNGEVYFPEPEVLRLVAPTARVEFGLASVLGANAVNVAAEATVGAFSGGYVMPIFLFQGCDYGPQTIIANSTDSYGRVPSTLSSPSDSAPGTVDKTVFAGSTPARIPGSAVGAILEIHGSSLNNTKHVGFFNASGTVVSAPVLTETNSKVTVGVPIAVTSTQTQWFVRVSKAAATGPWSSVDPDEIAAFAVGSAAVECDDDSSSGNFGMADLPRPDDTTVNTQEQTFAKNVAVGSTVNLDVYPTGTWKCTPSTSGPYIAPPTPNANCVDTKTGVPTFLTEALVTGNSGWGMPKGRLNADNSSLCGGSKLASGISGVSINNDALTCFFTNSSVTVDDISRSDYAGPTVLAPEIFSSPRFIWQPVFVQEPDGGGSSRYTIVDFRPGFITDQPLTAKRGDAVETSSTKNGLTISSSPGSPRVEQVRAIMFDVDALPTNFDGTPVSPYVGAGAPLLRLIN